MNAFDLISMSKGLNLGNLFDIEQVRKAEAFLSGFGLSVLYMLFHTLNFAWEKPSEIPSIDIEL